MTILRAVARAITAGACVGGILVMVADSARAAEFTYSFTPTQVTVTPSGQSDQVAISSTGSSIAFVSSQDGNPEIYLKNIGSSSVTKITNTSAPRIQANPKLGGDGDSLIFQSDADLVPGKNANLTPETFRRDGGGALRQLTDDQPFGPFTLAGPAPASRVSSANVTDDGLVIVYSSTIDCAGVRGNPEIYLYDSLDDICVQVTNTPSGASNLHPVIDGFGGTLAFVTNATSGTFGNSAFSINNPDGNYEVLEVGIQVVFNDPCTMDPSLPECDPCTLDPSLPECGDPCDIDPSGPGCETNSAPTISLTPSAPISVNEGQQLRLTINVTDLEGDMVALTATQGDGSALSAMGATFAVDKTGCDPDFEDCDCNPVVDQCFFADITATITWTPAAGKGGRDYQFLLEAEDLGFPEPMIASEAVLVSVTKVNRAPTITVSPTLPANETLKATSTARTYTITGTDADCDGLTLQALSLPSGATMSSPTSTSCGGAVTASKVTATVTWTPNTPSGTAQTLSVKVSDPGGLSATATGNFTVVSNQAPKLTLAPVTVVEGSSIKVTIKATDPDGDPVVYDIDPSTPLPSGAVYKPLVFEFNWLPWFGAAGGTTRDYLIKFRASDCPGGPSAPSGSCVTTTADLKVTVTYYDPNKAYFTGSSSSLIVAPSADARFSLSTMNTGTSTWTTADGIALAPKTVSYGLTTPTAVPLTQTVVPGQTVTFQANVQAPAKAGTYYLTWQLTDDNKAFGSSSSYTTLIVR